MADNGDDELMTFADEPEERLYKSQLRPWRILVVDDDEEVHVITKLVLRDYELENRQIDLLSAFSAAEAREVLQKENNIAVILLDVVMETDDAGLQLAKWIREDLKNRLVRIILRTGQPGAAPEKKVITDYEINDYKAKTEITDIKLYTAITVALRGYRDLKIIRRSKEGFEKIVQASGELFRNRSFSHFYSGVLLQLTGLLKMDDDSLYVRAEGLAVSRNKNEFRILAGTGRYSKDAGSSLKDFDDLEMTALIEKVIQKKESFFENDVYVGYFSIENGTENIIILKANDILTSVDKELIQVFSTNVAIAFTNMYLNFQMETTQKEIIFTLGEVVESRSKETGNHVRRVGEMAAVLAKSIGMSEQEVELLRLAAPMHDIGKIGISDNILNKPGKLDQTELVNMRKHTLIGSEILRTGKKGVLQLAATIALTHHERWDGDGYPKNLSKEDIPLVGRIVSVVDVFDALLHDRVYKPAWDLSDALTYIVDNKGTQFDPQIVDAFVREKETLLRIIDLYGE